MFILADKQIPEGALVSFYLIEGSNIAQNAKKAKRHTLTIDKVANQESWAEWPVIYEQIYQLYGFPFMRCPGGHKQHPIKVFMTNAYPGYSIEGCQKEQKLTGIIGSTYNGQGTLLLVTTCGPLEKEPVIVPELNCAATFPLLTHSTDA